MNDILKRIYEGKRRRLAAEERAEPYATLRERALAGRTQRRPFLQTIKNADGPAIVAEIKRASPSLGLISRDFDPSALAAAYDAGGADCISVLTESDHFLGELGHLQIVRARARCPLLRKDFLSTRYQVAQSAAYGADAILLIVAGLDDEKLRENLDEALLYDLDVLVEVHDAAELDRALNLGVNLLGINNRNLRTFETDLAVSELLLPQVTSNVTAISESGMRGPADIARLFAAGARGFLVGETLMRSNDLGGLIEALKLSSVGR
ncbi:MAG: indole-3-glycerol phosphate synthase TrpC [Candidatus Baltobacteraceae bacterium]